MSTKTIKTSELTGAALDWAVCASMPAAAGMQHEILNRPVSYRWKFSTDWSQGGPIIDRERLLTEPEIGKEGTGNAWSAVTMGGTVAYGPTLLIAAMRCFVASRLGDTVEVPEELLP